VFAKYQVAPTKHHDMVSLANLPQAPTGVLSPKPSTNLKRKHSDTASDDTVSSSQAKRLRVAFDPAVEVRIMPDWNEKGLDLVRDEVRHALNKHASGDSTSYEQIKQLFESKPSDEDAPSSALLCKYIMALTGHVSSLSKSYSTLVHAILDTRWLLRSEIFVALYGKFLGSLMSAQGGYIGLILHSLVTNFVQLPSSASRHAEDPQCGRLQMLSRTHESLKSLIQLIPAASSVLLRTISTVFPHSSDTTKAHVSYVKNIRRVADYAPELRGTVLALVTERLIKIDVQIQTDMEELEEDIEEDLLNGTLGRTGLDPDEDDSVLSDSSDSESDDEEVDDEEKRIQELKETVHKLDAILDVLFDYYQPSFDKDTSSDEVFDHLLSQFSNTILPTYRSRHTQFLLFHFVQTNPIFIDTFTATCAGIAYDKTRPQIIRVAAAAYLASFVARGARVDRSITQAVFQLLSDQLEGLRLTYEPNCTGPDLRRYGAYYAFAQALLYIFCFRWRDLIVDEDEIDDEDIRSGDRDFTWLPGVKETLHKNILSKLNPLKVCSPDVVNQFARIANHLHFLYIYSKIETNKRLRLGRTIESLAMYGVLPERQSALSVQTEESAFQLDAYFPFDPYRLPKSKRWLEGDYNEWRNVPGMDMPERNNDDDTDHEEESDFDEDYDDATESEGSR
jgi:RNA polymerase I-specific transcription initiation factor RRN3